MISSSYLQRVGQSSNRPRLTGWAAMEDFLRKYDEGMINDLDDDIETLLVFVRIIVPIKF